MFRSLAEVSWCSGFDPGAEFPDERGEFARDGDFDFVVMNSAFSKIL